MTNNIDPSKIIVLPPNRDNPSKIIHKMTPEERSEIESELFSEYTTWGVHPLFDPTNPRANVFKHGKSFHIYNTDFNGNILEDFREQYPKTLSYITKWSGYDLSRIGRTYWHRLNPNERIELHHDNSNGYFRTVDRFHVYLDVPVDFHVVLDGELWNVYPEKRLTNAVVDFNLYDVHFFVNYTENPVYMLIFDFYPDD
jgi:Aspartyl/Asparaginyl beta-hydroxylase